MLRARRPGAPDRDIIALSPPLIIEQSQIDQIFGTLSAVLRRAIAALRQSRCGLGVRPERGRRARS